MLPVSRIFYQKARGWFHFTVFTSTGRYSKEVSVGPGMEFQSLTDFYGFLETHDRYAQQTLELKVAEAFNERLTFKEKLELAGWCFNEEGVLIKPLSRCQYGVQLKN